MSKEIFTEIITIGMPMLGILVLVSRHISKFSKGTYVVSTVDGKEYFVRNTKEKQQAADLLAQLNQRMAILINDFRTSNDIPPAMKYATDRIVRLYNPEVLSENVALRGDHTSYTLNKGEEIALCLTDGSDTTFEPLNKLMFVFLHEVSHIGASSNSGNKHNKEFWDVFAFVYRRAMRLGIYSYVDYNSKPQMYCGVEVARTPI